MYSKINKDVAKIIISKYSLHFHYMNEECNEISAMKNEKLWKINDEQKTRKFTLFEKQAQTRSEREFENALLSWHNALINFRKVWNAE